MKKIEKNLLEKKNSVLFSVVLNLIVLIALVILFRPVYETNDDMALSNIVDGARGVYSPNLIFMNRAIGYLLCALYQICAIVPWYAVLHYVVLFLSFTVITNIIMKRMSSVYQMLAYTVFLIVFSYEGLIKIQFTKTAAIATVAGVIVLLAYLWGEKISKRYLVFGFILAVVGSMYRIEQFFLGLLLLSGIGVMLLLKEKESKLRLKLVGKTLLLFLPLLIIVLGAYLWDRQGYKSDEWKEYIEYNSVRGKLYDFGFPEYEQYKEDYEKMDIDENSFWFYRTWNHLDDERFSVDTMNKLIDMKDKKSVSRDMVSEFFHIIPIGVLHIPCFCAVITVFIMWLLCGGVKREELLSLLYESVVVAGVYAYLFYEGRYLKNRVDVGIWLVFALIILWGDWKKRKKTRRIGVVLALTCAFTGMLIFKPELRDVSQAKRDEVLANRQKVTEVMKKKDGLYLQKAINTIDLSTLYGPFERIPENMFENLGMLGGWLVNLPMQNDLLKRYNLTNPICDMVDRKDVFIIDANINLTLGYIRKWYKPTAEAKLVKDMGQYQIYQIYTKE